MGLTRTTIDPAHRAGALTKAVLAAAKHLGVPGGLLARILRASEGSVVRMQAGAEVLAIGSAETVRGELFLQLFYSLDSAMDNVDDASRAWLNSNCLELEGRPINVIQTNEGLTRAVIYLGAKRRKPKPV